MTAQSAQDRESPYVAVVDDDPAICKSIRLLLAPLGFSVEMFASGGEVIDSLVDRMPDCLITDLRLPDISGLAMLRRIGELHGFHPPCIVITGHADVATAVQAMREGALDLLEKPFAPQRLLDQVQLAVRMSRETRQAQRQRHEVSQSLACLSHREREILDQLLSGKPNKTIAAELDLSVKTIATHRAHILEKVGASSLVELVQMIQPAGRPHPLQTAGR